MDSPLEEYPVDWESVAHAATGSFNDWQPPLSTNSRSRSNSIHSAFGSAASDSSCASSASNKSGASISSRASRKGRRRYVTAPSFPKKAAPGSKKPHRYFCTFCPKGFVGRYEWNRHEEAVHLSRTLWICRFDHTGQLVSDSTQDSPEIAEIGPRAPSQHVKSNTIHTNEDFSGSTTCSNCFTKTTPLWRRGLEGQPLCNACGLFLKLHGVVRPLSLKTDVLKKRSRGGTTALKLRNMLPFPGLDCTQRSQQERTFFRRDHLVQHVLRNHKADISPHDIDRCKVAADPLISTHLALRCGFCGFWARSWEERSEHLSNHFSIGIADMSEWWLRRRRNELRLSSPAQ